MSSLSQKDHVTVPVTSPSVKKRRQHAEGPPNAKKKLTELYTESTSLQKYPKSVKEAKKDIPLHRQLMIDHMHELVCERNDQQLPSDHRRVNLINSLSHLNAKAVKGWTESVKEISFALFHNFPEEYDFLSKFLSLPRLQDLQQWISGLFTGCGFKKEIFHGLQYKVSSLKDSERVCSLSLKELPLKSEISYSSKGDHLAGLVNYGNFGMIKRMATQVLVFSVRGITKEWSLPVGYFLTEKNIPSSMLKLLLLECISRLSEINLRVKVIICEPTKNYRSLYNDLGVRAEAPYFKFANSDIFCMFDPLYLRNLVRNTLKKGGICFGKKLCSWKYIEELNDFEVKMSEELNLGLKKNRSTFAEAKASQEPFTIPTSSKILAMSVSSQAEFKKEAEQTSEFIRKMHDLCSLFGCSLNKVKFDETRVEALQELYKWVKSWRADLTGGSVCGQTEWLITIQCLLHLGIELHYTYKFNILFMGRLHIKSAKELSHCWVDENEERRILPNAKTFYNMYNEYTCRNLLKPVRNSKYSFDLIHFVLKYEELMKANKVMSSENICSYHCLPETENVKLLEVNKLAFIACHIIKKLRVVVSCKNCLGQLTQSHQSVNAKSVASRGNKNSKIMQKKLTVIAPHEKFLRIMPRLEASFLFAFKHLYHMPRIKVKIHQFMYGQNNFDDLDLDCEDVKKIIIGLFINISLDHITSVLSMTNGHIVIPEHL